MITLRKRPVGGWNVFRDDQLIGWVVDRDTGTGPREWRGYVLDRWNDDRGHICHAWTITKRAEAIAEVDINRERAR